MKAINMKNCICCLSILILTSLVACTGTEESPLPPKAAELEQIASATRIGQAEEEASMSVDSVLAEEVAEEEKSAELELVLEQTEILKEISDKGEVVAENYIESIPFTTFIGIPVELGALEIVQFEDQYTRVYADYFDGEPIGGKLFFIKNDSLVAIEIIQLRETITENGASIKDEHTHILYYHEEVLLSITDLSTNKTLEASEIGWLDENLADWKLVKTHLNTL